MSEVYHCDSCGVELPDHEYGDPELCPTCQTAEDCPEDCLDVTDEKAGSNVPRGTLPVTGEQEGRK